MGHLLSEGVGVGSVDSDLIVGSDCLCSVPSTVVDIVVAGEVAVGTAFESVNDFCCESCSSRGVDVVYVDVLLVYYDAHFEGADVF